MYGSDRVPLLPPLMCVYILPVHNWMRILPEKIAWLKSSPPTRWLQLDPLCSLSSSDSIRPLSPNILSGSSSFSLSLVYHECSEDRIICSNFKWNSENTWHAQNISRLGQHFLSRCCLGCSCADGGAIGPSTCADSSRSHGVSLKRIVDGELVQKAMPSPPKGGIQTSGVDICEERDDTNLREVLDGI